MISSKVILKEILVGYKLKEKPDDRFYDILRNLTKIGNNLNQIAYRANYSNLIDKNYYDENAKEVRKFVSQIREEYL